MPLQKYAPTLITTLGNYKQNTLDINTLPVTPSDTIDLPGGITTGLLCTTSGTLTCNLPGSGTATLVMTAGQFILVNVSRVLATGTTGACAAAYN